MNGKSSLQAAVNSDHTGTGKRSRLHKSASFPAAGACPVTKQFTHRLIRKKTETGDNHAAG